MTILQAIYALREGKALKLKHYDTYYFTLEYGKIKRHMIATDRLVDELDGICFKGFEIMGDDTDYEVYEKPIARAIIAQWEQKTLQKAVDKKREEEEEEIIFRDIWKEGRFIMCRYWKGMKEISEPLFEIKHRLFEKGPDERFSKMEEGIHYTLEELELK